MLFFGFDDSVTVAAQSSQKFVRTVPDFSPTVMTLRGRTLSLCYAYLHDRPPLRVAFDVEIPCRPSVRYEPCGRPYFISGDSGEMML